MVRLGDVCTFYSGTGFPNIYQGKADGKYPFYKVGDISRNVLSGNRELKICENYIDDDTATKIKGTLLPPQTVVFAKIGEALRLNRRAITSRDCLVDNNAMGIKSDDSIIDSLYFYYFMCNVDLQNYCESTTVPSVRKTRIAEIEIPLPPLDEQRRIAAVLDKVSGLIAKRREQLAKLDELVKARFVEMFGDPIKNEKGFPTITGQDFFKLSNGKFVPENKRFDNGVPAYGGNGISWYTDEILYHNDTIVVGRVGFQSGNVHLAKGPLWVTDNAMYISDYQSNKYNLLFLYALIEHINFTRFQDAGDLKKITQKPFMNMEYIMPTLAQQQEYVSFSMQTEKSKLTIQQSLDKLEVLKKALMQQYFG